MFYILEALKPFLKIHFLFSRIRLLSGFSQKPASIKLDCLHKVFLKITLYEQKNPYLSTGSVRGTLDRGDVFCWPLTQTMPIIDSKSYLT